MIGSVVLTVERPLVKYSDGMCARLDRGRTLFGPVCEGVPAYVMVRPYKGTYPYTRVLDPIRVPGTMVGSGGWAFMYIIHEYQSRKGLRKYTFLRLGNRVRRHVSEGDMGLFSGVTKRGMYGLIVDMFRSSVERYVKRSVGIYLAELKVSAALDEVETLLSARGLRAARDGNLVKAYGKGIAVLARGSAHGTVNVSIAVGVGMQMEFMRLVVGIFRNAGAVHGVRLGELGEAPALLDLFLPVDHLGERD